MNRPPLSEVARSLVDRVVAQLVGMGVVGPPEAVVPGDEPAPRVAHRPVVVAVSGGLDSCALLHMLRFGPCEVPLVVAHLDHGMRRESRADAAWITGVCRAWGLPFAVERAESAPKSEEAARAARYDFLERVRVRVGARWILTAHHADDQAETILFRILRGSGIEGLRGIPALRPSHARPVADRGAASAPSELHEGIARPLLRTWRDELVEYADAVHLTWRDDATNADLRFARNALRHRILPDIQRLVAPEAPRALLRLGEHADSDEEAWAEVMPRLLDDLDADSVTSVGFSLDRGGLAAMGSGLRARVLRHLAGRMGFTLDSGTTARAVDFVPCGRSGRGIELGQGLLLERELDRVVLRRSVTRDREPADGANTQRKGDRPVVIQGIGAGTAEGCVGGAPVRVTWDTSMVPEPAVVGEESRATFGIDQVAFPITVRGRKPGDRIQTGAGSKKVKKLLLEARVPLSERDRIPVVVDHSGRVLWVRGIARAADPAPEGPGPRLTVTIAGLRPGVARAS